MGVVEGRSLPVHRGNLLGVIERAWGHASRVADRHSDEGERNKERSQQWVNALAEEFQKKYNDKKLHRVFWQRNKENREEFDINEFLFDVMVCGVSHLKSLQHRSKWLEYIDQCHWQVESEFNRSTSRAVILDMSKLVVGSAENKLFIAAHRPTQKSESDFLRLCAGIARRCSGNIYFALVAHPGEWEDAVKKNDRKPELYKWVAGGWERLGARKQDGRTRAQA